MSDFEIFRGDDKTLEVVVKDQDGNVVDITGSSIRCTVKEHETDPDTEAKISKSSDTPSEITLTDPTQGKFEVYFVPTDTDNLLGDYVYDIQIETSAGKKYTVLKGFFKVKMDVTKA